jgi:hypothetical protein
MNTPPTIQGKQLRTLNRFIWARLCEMMTAEKCRGKNGNTIIIYGFAALAMADDATAKRAIKDDEAFFDAMAEACMSLSDDDENQIGEYVQGVIDRWEAAQLQPKSDEGKPQI